MVVDSARFLILSNQKTHAHPTITQFVGLDAEEALDMESFHALLSPRTKLVALPHVSNTLGCVCPVKEVVAAAHELGAVVLVDACQSVPHMKVGEGGGRRREGGLFLDI